MPKRVCSVHGCPELYERNEGSKCTRHRREADTARGTATDRGYNTPGHRNFRNAVLQRDPICVICHKAETTDADHHPRGRDELIRLGLNPNDPQYGRGLCSPCHKSETALHQPGGWHRH